jgi:DNA-binding NarL/FixJ family response regulator
MDAQRWWMHVQAALDTLTTGERQVVQLIGERLSNKEIAHQLALSDGTINVHPHNIYKKLQMSSRIMLALLASSIPRPAAEIFTPEI